MTRRAAVAATLAALGGQGAGLCVALAAGCHRAPEALIAAINEALESGG